MRFRTVPPLHRRSTLALLVLLGGVFGGAPAAAQQLPLKRTVPASAGGGCLGAPPLAQPTSQAREQAARLAASGNQAAILGNNEAARDLLRRAVQLDPTDAETAYRLGRVHEELGEGSDAAAQYCRYLNLATDPADAAEIRGRIAALAPSDPRQQEAAAAFHGGVERFDAGDAAGAVRAFDDALRRAPWSVSFYNRGVAYSAQGDPRQARADLERYLQLEPAAPDRGAVQARIAALGGPAPGTTPGRVPSAALPGQAPSSTLVSGLLVPGLGQIRTGRPGLGALVIAGTGAAVWVAVQPRDETVVEIRTTPFGTPYPDTVTVSRRPDLALGIGLAAAISALGAVEAYSFARRARGAAAVATVQPLAHGVRVGISLPVGGRSERPPRIPGTRGLP